jgi:hypothetical protein
VGTPEVRRWVVTGHIVSPRTPGDNPPSAVPRRTTDRGREAGPVLYPDIRGPPQFAVSGKPDRPYALHASR